MRPWDMWFYDSQECKSYSSRGNLVEKIVHVNQPEDRCQDRSLGKTFGKSPFPPGWSLPWNWWFTITEEATDPPDVACWLLASPCVQFWQGEPFSTLCHRLLRNQPAVVPCVVEVFVAENHLESAGTLLPLVPQLSGFFWSLPEMGGADSKTPTDTSGTPGLGVPLVCQYRVQ